MDDIYQNFRSYQEPTDAVRLGTTFVSAESRVINREVFDWLGELASWRKLPKPVVVTAILICKRFSCLTFMVRESPTFSEILRDVCLPWHLPVPERASVPLLELHSVIPQLHSSTKFALIVREKSDLFELMSVVDKRNTSYPTLHAEGHSYRNSEIESYRDAIVHLSNSGVATIRVGRTAGMFLNDSPINYFDYAGSKHRSDVSDIAIASAVDAVISPAIGLDALYELFNKPIIGVNVPWVDATVRNHLLVMPKHMYIERSGLKSELPICILTSPDTTWDDRHRPIWRGYEVQFESNSSEEITEALSLALELLSHESRWQEEYSNCHPLWLEFWRRAEVSEMKPFQRVNNPTIIIPKSVRQRFF